MSDNIRLDVLLVKRGMVASREKGRTLIKEGKVFASGVCIEKPGAMFDEEVQIEIKGESFRYVSRGGYKLEKIIESNNLSLDGFVCMDVGASTGGFTDCMLQNGASKVYAVDVGTKQLDQKLLTDERVISMENTNMRYLVPESIGEKVDFVSVDVSFISVLKLLDAIRGIMKDKALIACLVKPQFEAGRENIGKGGIVKNPGVHRSVLTNVSKGFEEKGFTLRWMDYSPIRGTDGNIEYLILAENSDGVGENRLTDECFITRLVESSHREL